LQFEVVKTSSFVLSSPSVGMSAVTAICDCMLGLVPDVRWVWPVRSARITQIARIAIREAKAKAKGESESGGGGGAWDVGPLCFVIRLASFTHAHVDNHQSDSEKKAKRHSKAPGEERPNPGSFGVLVHRRRREFFQRHKNCRVDSWP
jgi:hypothetical protein